MTLVEAVGTNQVDTERFDLRFSDYPITVTRSLEQGVIRSEKIAKLAKNVGTEAKCVLELQGYLKAKRPIKDPRVTSNLLNLLQVRKRWTGTSSELHVTEFVPNDGSFTSLESEADLESLPSSDS